MAGVQQRRNPKKKRPGDESGCRFGHSPGTDRAKRGYAHRLITKHDALEIRPTVASLWPGTTHRLVVELGRRARSRRAWKASKPLAGDDRCPCRRRREQPRQVWPRRVVVSSSPRAMSTQPSTAATGRHERSTRAPSRPWSRGRCRLKGGAMPEPFPPPS
jgi:hypothetical protein